MNTQVSPYSSPARPCIPSVLGRIRVERTIVAAKSWSPLECISVNFQSSYPCWRLQVTARGGMGIIS
ncbi:hypothetical protein XA68_13502 [Ophiocordyceps unilateralis]|uniref:Uncharacterized protein n=1 Tax=Ophiocordyceps unilateralis TaxID=268505 RepID=A0A2A9PLR7_OPHUN|nr:hypothetical protein XA68_13502 [Ophiocordyceps unilateralis]